MYPYGLAPTGTTGTTPDGVQQITYAQYGGVGGRIYGCEVSRLSTMEYQVGAGAVVVINGSNRAVIVPVSPVKVATTAAPSTGSRRDYIVVNGDTNGTVSVKQSAPSSGAIIAELVVPAGISGTNGATPVADTRFAMPTGTPLGPLVPRWTDPAAFQAEAYRPEFTLYDVTLPLVPTDRWIEIRLTQNVYASKDGGATPGGEGSFKYMPTVTNFAGPQLEATEISFGKFFESKQYTWGFWALAGPNPTRVTIKRKHQFGDNAYHFPGGTIDVIDRGGAH